MKKRVFTTIAAITFLASTGSLAYATSINLTGTIRDFHDSHSDFERFDIPTVHEPGIVQSTLGSDGKPQFNAPSVSVTSGSSFNQWYNHVDGVNMSKLHTITLEDSDNDGVFNFSDTSFFPIDGDLFGKEGRSHNYHFTYELHSSFTYTGGEFFNFTGDDDLWVFIDNQLALDIGGVHPAAQMGADLTTLGLTTGNDYDFDLFFAERRTTQSNFSIETSIAFNPVPEPTTMLLFGTGLAGLAGVARRRKKK